jgi:hypothetical protein
MSIGAASPFGMGGDAGFAAATLNQANHSMKMKYVRPVGIGCRALDPDTTNQLTLRIAPPAS